MQYRRGVVSIWSMYESSASDDVARANLFNDFFQSVFTRSLFNIPATDNSGRSETLSSVDIIDTEVYEALVSLDHTKAMGLDGYCPALLKSCAIALYEPLTHLFNLSVTNHCLPAEWKLHGITPIYKAGDRSSVKNYRPISLLSSTSKVLERIIYNKCAEFLHPKISKHQFGFLPKHSTLQQLLLFCNSILDNLCMGARSDVVYLDFAKAFDSVPHQELLYKLRLMGIDGNLWLWFQDYLSDRFQCVCIGSCRSNLLSVLSGVPQGSILGPLLFIAYINDLPTSDTSMLYTFADDTKCLTRVNDQRDCIRMQDDLDHICEWSREWKMRFNVPKCVCLSYSRKGGEGDHTYFINGAAVPHSDTHRDLGIVMSEDLTWCAHYSNLTCKAYKVLGLLRRNFNVCGAVAQKRKLYLSLVRSTFNYCSSIWRPHLIKDIMTLETVQRRASKFVLNDYSMDYRNRLKVLKLLPLMYHLELNDIMLAVRCFKSPEEHFNLNKYVAFCHSGTRSGSHSKLRHTRSPLNIVKHSFFHRLPRLWNALPPIDLSQSALTIKRKLTVFLFDHFESTFNSDDPCSFHYVCPCNRCSLTPHNPTFT